MKILNAEETRQALPMRATIEAMKAAYAALSGGRAEIPLRIALPIAPEEATSLFMPAFDLVWGIAFATKDPVIFPPPKLADLRASWFAASGGPLPEDEETSFAVDRDEAWAVEVGCVDTQKIRERPEMP